MKLVTALSTLSLLTLSGCATVDGVHQTPCQRATRAADTAHAGVEIARSGVNAAVIAGANAVVIAKLNAAVDAAQALANTASAAAAGVCAAAAPAVP